MELNQQQRAAITKALDPSVRFLFITGQAGTGKSAIIDAIRNANPKGTVVCASTGMAASLIGGTTLHSTFKLSAEVFIPSSDVRYSEICERVETIVIEEMPMIRADTLDCLDKTLRVARRSTKPFGGVKIVAVGDCAQLPAVLTKEETEIFLDHYMSTWWFDARVIEKVDVHVVELSTIYRQQDPGFMKLLEKSRDGEVPETWIDRLNERCKITGDIPDSMPLLTSVKKAARVENDRRLEQLATPAKVYNGTRRGTYLADREESLPVDLRLSLKIGAKVIVAKNTLELTNGLRGTVTNMMPKGVMVRLDSTGKDVFVGEETWEKRKYSLEGGALKADIAGSYTQIPLVLGWAITVHKSQGMTLDEACVDLGGGAFASGQAYVAISRVRSLNGLRLRRPLRPKDFFADPNVKHFMQRIRASSQNGEGVLLACEEDESPIG